MRGSSLQIRTPEGIVFAQLLAGPVLRFMAWLLDTLCCIALILVVSTILNVFAVALPSLANAAMILAYFSINIGYNMFMEWAWRGQTIGKRLTGLRVVDAEGMRLQLDQIITRNLLRFVDMLPLAYLVGGLSCWLGAKCQRIGDIAANTIVVRVPKIKPPNIDHVLAGKFNSLRQYSHLTARLRQRVSPGEAAVALQALMRRDDFDPIARVELFEQLAAHFRAKVDFPAEAIDGVTAEQYIRNVVDVVYRSSQA